MDVSTLTESEAVEGLFVAAEHGRSDVICAMIEHLNQASKQPLEGDEIKQRSLANASVELFLNNRRGKTPLDIAVANNKVDVVRVLLASDFPCHLRNPKTQQTPYELAKEKNLTAIIQVFHQHVLQQIAMEHIQNIQICLDGGVGVNTTDGSNFNNSFLHWACSLGSLPAVEILCSSHADVNIRNALGATPLHEAVYHKKYECVKYLLEHDQTNIDLKGHAGYCQNKTPRDIALDSRIITLFHGTKRSESTTLDTAVEAVSEHGIKDDLQSWQNRLEEKERLVEQLKSTIEILIEQQQEIDTIRDGTQVLDYIRKIREERDDARRQLAEANSYIEYQTNFIADCEKKSREQENRIQELEKIASELPHFQLQKDRELDLSDNESSEEVTLTSTVITNDARMNAKDPEPSSSMWSTLLTSAWSLTSTEHRGVIHGENEVNMTV